jgi:hypothetical protein
MRRFDKNRLIMEANQRLEIEYLRAKGFSTEDFNETTFDISEETYTTILIDSLNENNIEHNILIKEDKELLIESWTMVGIGAALASGKLMDLIGSMLRKIANIFRKEKKTEKNWLERTGEKLQKKVILVPFRILATIILGFIEAIISAGINFGQDDHQVVDLNNKDNVEKMANTLFYITASILGIQGFMSLAHSHGIFQAAIEATASTTKLYEIILVLISWGLVTWSKNKKTWSSFGTSKIAHQLGECIESHGGIRKVIGLLGKKGKSDTWECVYEGLTSGEH